MLGPIGRLWNEDLIHFPTIKTESLRPFGIFGVVGANDRASKR